MPAAVDRLTCLRSYKRGDAAGGGRPLLTQYLKHRDDECALRKDHADKTPGLPVQRFLKVSLQYLKVQLRYRDRHGNMRVYYRRRGRKVRLYARPGSAEFQIEYDQVHGPQTTSHLLPETYRGLVIRYTNSSEFRSLEPSTQRQKVRVLESTCLEPYAPGTDKLMAECPIKAFGRQHVRTLRDRKAAHREAARHRLKTMSQMFEWALDADVEGVTHNPVLNVKYPKPLPGGGHHTWTFDEKEKFEERHPIGSKARLAFGLLYYTGLRVSDVVRLSRAHVQRDGSLRITLHKNRNRSPVTLQLPILDELKAIMDASELGAPSFLVNDFGHAFASENSFGNKMRDWCNQAGLPHCTAHGLRKAGATLAAEEGATPHELKAMFGWMTLKQAEAYTKMAEQKGLAARGMQRLSRQKATKLGT